MIDWPRVAVKEVCSLIVDCVNRTAPVLEHVSPYRMIRTTNVKDGRIDLSTCKHVDRGTFERWTRRARVLDGDVILTREAPIGEVGYVSGLGTVFLGQRIMQYRPDPAKVVPRYLYYAFRSPDLQHQFGTHDGSGSVVSHIRVADCHEFKVSIPPMRHQERVVVLLGSLDDKIELNRRTNETLEAMAQAIFRDWFVDFGPTRRKLEGATDPVTIMGGLVTDPTRAQELPDLFPATLGDDGLPEGWREYSIGEVATQHTKSLSPSSHPQETFVHYSLPAFDKGRHPTLDVGASILSNKTIVPDGAVLLSKLNPEIPRIWLTESRSDSQSVSSTEFLVYTPAANFSRALIYSLFCSDPFRKKLVGMVTGTSKSHQRVSPKALQGLRVLPSAPAVAKSYGDLVGPLLELVQHNLAEARTLAATRDLLLPKLMSGEIRLGEAEEIVEAAQ